MIKETVYFFELVKQTTQLIIRESNIRNVFVVDLNNILCKQHIQTKNCIFAMAFWFCKHNYNYLLIKICVILFINSYSLYSNYWVVSKNKNNVVTHIKVFPVFYTFSSC